MTDKRSIVPVTDAKVIESVVMNGDLSKLTSAQRVDYYRAVCDSLGLNPLTQPFAYIKLQGKEVLYAKRDAADQLRKIHGISIDRPEIDIQADMVIVTATGHDKTGRTDSDVGTVSLVNLSGEARANAILKAITKAKRRLTLSIVGLGWLDETEIETIPGAVVVTPELPAEVVPFVFNPEPPDLDTIGGWVEFRQEAVERLGFENAESVKAALKAVFNGNAATVTYRDAWAALVEYRQAQMADSETIDGVPQ